MEDPWGPGCDGHAALSNGDCEEVIDANGDRYIPASKVVEHPGAPFRRSLACRDKSESANAAEL
jgi:hypothetical protein